MSTLSVALEVPDLNKDCITLHSAMEDLGCNKKALLGVICHRNQQQRSEIRHMYGDKYEHDLVQRLQAKLHGNLEKAVALWMCDPPERDAMIVRNALRGWIKDLNAVTEIIYLRTASQISDIRKAYSSMFTGSLEEDIALKTCGDEKKFLLALVREDRPDDVEPDMWVVEADAKDLLVAVSQRSTPDQALIIKIVSTRSPLQMKAILEQYRQMYGHSFGKVIKQARINRGFLGLLRVALKCAKNPVNYFAKALYSSMKGLGTDDPTLVRIVVTRAEIDMKDIKAHFSKKYGRSLQEMIISDTSGKYRTFLLLLVGATSDEMRSVSSLSHLFGSSRR